MGDEPDRVPFYEHFVDNEAMEAMTGEPATKLVPIDLGTARSMGVKAKKLDLRKKRYARILVRFYQGLRYDCVPLELPLNLPRTNIRERKRGFVPTSIYR